VRTPHFDLTNLDTFQDGFPHEVFTWLRADAPAYWHEPTVHTPQGEGVWVVSRHADALAIQLDPKRSASVSGGSRERGGTMIAEQYGAGLMLHMMDDPRHRRIPSLTRTPSPAWGRPVCRVARASCVGWPGPSSGGGTRDPSFGVLCGLLRRR
jgi:cytochrome P450